ncbi:MAG TPA: tetratricopeptide repeat protein, partial [Planctomycetota bacterium]|nr:tetratricopeptide repeat protein [Planctomycetota bacterium]
MGTVRCPECGAHNEESAISCKQCGHERSRAGAAAGKKKGGAWPGPKKKTVEKKVETPVEKVEPQRAAPAPTIAAFSAAELLGKSAEDTDLLLADRAEAAATASNAPWLHCAPFEPRQITAEVRIGRAPDADFILPHVEVSRIHAVVKTLPSGEIVIEDNGSANGLHVNGKRVKTGPIKVGDRIGIGPFKIDVGATKEAPASSITQSGEPAAEATERSSEAALELESTMLMGRLGKVSLEEMLRHAERERKTGTLKIWGDKGAKGEIVIAKGRPCGASWEGLRDEDALRALLDVKEGSFAFSIDLPSTPATMNKDLSVLLAEIAHQREARAGQVAGKVGAEAKQFFGLLEDYASRPKPQLPEDARAFANRGATYARRGELDRAIEDLTRAVEIDPQLVSAWFNRGLARERKGETSLAILDYSRAIAIAPDTAALWARRAVARGTLGDYDGCIEDCGRILIRDPRAATVYITR